MITFLTGLSCFLVVIYFALRVITIVVSKREGERARFFVTVKPGRIKRRVRGENIIEYFANLKERVKHIDEKTGVILDGQEGMFEGNNGSFWWRFFGVRWIGLDSIYTSPMEKYNLKGDASGNLEKITEITESLFFQGSYLDKLLDAESKGGIRVSLTFRVLIETVHAGKTSTHKFFLPLVLDPIKAMQRDFIGSLSPEKILSMHYAGKLKSKANKDFAAMIGILNPGIEDIVGQKIVSINVIGIEIHPEDIAKIEAKKNAQLAGDAAIVASERAITVATNKAKAAIEEAKGTSEASRLNLSVGVEMIERGVKAMGGDTEAYATVASSEALSKFHGGSLVIGNASILTPLGKESAKGKEEPK